MLLKGKDSDWKRDIVLLMKAIEEVIDCRKGALDVMNGKNYI